MRLAASIATSGSLLRLVDVACREPYIEIVSQTQFLSKLFPYIHIQPSSSLSDDEKAFKLATALDQRHWQEALIGVVCPPLTLEMAFSILERKLIFEGFKPSQLESHAFDYVLKYLPVWLNSSERSDARAHLARFARQLSRIKIIKNRRLAELNPEAIDWLLSRISAEAEIIDISGSQIIDLEMFARFKGLRELYLNDCANLDSLKGLAECCINLRVLSLARCYDLNWNIEHLGRKPQLAVLDLQGIPIWCYGNLGRFRSLKQLNIKGCPALEWALPLDVEVIT